MHDFHDDTYYDGLKEASDLSSPLVVAPSPEFSTISDHPHSSLIVGDSSLHLAPLGELEEGDGFETDANSNDQYGILVESKDIFYEEYSLDEPSRNYLMIRCCLRI